MGRERDDGFLHADVDTNLYSDPKVVALAKRLKDPTATAGHVTLYLSLVLASWRQGERLTVDEASPAWWLDHVDDERGNLEAVDLIDSEGRIPEHVWERWYRPAFDRRERRRENGAEGGRRSWDKRRSSNAEATLNQTDIPSVLHTLRPSVTPSDSAPCPICRESLRDGAFASDGVIAAKKGREVHDVHRRCFEDRGDEWRAA